MLNPFFLAYLFILLIFLGGVGVISYHLYVYKLNKHMALIVITIFLVGALIFLLISLILATQVEWSQWALIF